MGKLAIKSSTSGPTKEELYGRVLEGLAGTDVDRFNAYKRAMGADNVKLENYVEQSPAINVQRRGKWVEPDKGIDVYDFTTDMVPELPAIGGAAIGGATAGIQGAVGGATIGNLIKQKIAQKMGLRKGINEGEAKFEGAMELLGPIGAAIPTPNVMARTVFHGSPHVFDKFDMSKIGTGEGAQAYGHGLYFAEAPEVAKSYTKVDPMGGPLPAPRRTYGGVEVEPGTPEYKAAQLTKELGPKKAQKFMSDAIRNSHPEDVKGREWYTQVLEQLNRGEKSGLLKAKRPGTLYTVDIPDEHIDRMLDWDKPLSEQSEYVRNALAKIDPNFHNAKADIVIKRLESNSNDGFGILVEDGKFDAYNQYTGANSAFSTYEEAVNWLRPQIEKKIGDSVSGKDIYENMFTKNGRDQIGRMSISGQLREAGIPGIKYLDGTSRTAGAGTQNFVVFDDNLPKILGRK